jgi:6,7-dimethyl-8-ribityllumazine synthase
LPSAEGRFAKETAAAMSEPRETSHPPRVLVVDAVFYADIAEALLSGAAAELDGAGARWRRLSVPGAFEIPAAIEMVRRAAERGNAEAAFDGAVALGCVIRGETTHYDYVCVESARGLQELGVRHGLPIGYGILTCESGEQAWERADPARKNKGGDAARACLEMIALKTRLGLRPV